MCFSSGFKFPHANSRLVRAESAAPEKRGAGDGCPKINGCSAGDVSCQTDEWTLKPFHYFLFHVASLAVLLLDVISDS